MRARLIAGAAVLGAALAAGGAAAAVAATASPAPAGQPVCNWVYACVGPAGNIAYLEFRDVPHACWHAGESLWRWPAVIPPPVSPTATPTS